MVERSDTTGYPALPKRTPDGPLPEDKESRTTVILLTQCSHRGIIQNVRVISHRAIVEAARRHPDAGAALDNWYRITRRARWSHLAETRRDFGHADPVGDLTVFNIKGKPYRLIARIIYATQKVFVRRVLTHVEYDRGGWQE